MEILAEHPVGRMPGIEQTLGIRPPGLVKMDPEGADTWPAAGDEVRGGQIKRKGSNTSKIALLSMSWGVTHLASLKC